MYEGKHRRDTMIKTARLYSYVRNNDTPLPKGSPRLLLSKRINLFKDNLPNRDK
jgi:hypothetical protein